ncbi:MAG: Caspase domain [Chthonomonadales bacterium]|nr:Caspase domain [Chthonomonadales bacterium]
MERADIASRLRQLLMGRREFVTAAGGVLLSAGALALTGCGGGGGNAGNGGAANDGYGRGAVDGVVFVNNTGVLTLGDPAAPPAGATPAKSAHLEVVGEGITANTGADGAFHLTQVRAGVRTLRISQGTVTKDVALTVVADAVISLKPTPISRDQALTAVRAALSIPANALVCATQQPLPAGVVLRSAENATQGATQGTTLATAQWFVFLDLVPGSPFGHPTQFALVDARTGVATIQTQEFWPVLNGCQHYAIAAYAPVTADVIQGGRAAVAVSLPSRSVETTRAAGRTRAADTGTTYATVIAGWPRYDMLADTIHIPTLLGKGGIPAGTPMTLLAPHADRSQILSAWSAACLQATEGDTILFYLSTHGAKEGYAVLATHNVAPAGTPDADLFRIQDDGTRLLAERLAPADLLPALKTCLSCEVILMIDTCYSGVWADSFATVTLSRKAMPLTVLTASDAAHMSKGIPLQPVHETDPPPPGAGAVYTNAFLAAFSELAATGGTNAVNLLQAHTRAAITLSRDPDPLVQAQNPQIFNHMPPAGTSCGVTLTPTTASVNPKDLKTVDFSLHVDSIVPADGAYTYEFATTGTQGTLVSAAGVGSGTTVHSEHAVIGYLAKIDARSGATDDITVKVSTKESTPRLVGSAKATLLIAPPAPVGQVTVTVTNPTADLAGTFPSGPITLMGTGNKTTGNDRVAVQASFGNVQTDPLKFFLGPTFPSLATGVSVQGGPAGRGIIGIDHLVGPFRNLVTFVTKSATVTITNVVGTVVTFKVVAQLYAASNINMTSTIDVTAEGFVDLP